MELELLFFVKERGRVLIKLIYEDEQLDKIKEQIKQLETNQLYFIEEFVRKEKLLRKQKVFQEWKETLNNVIEENKEGQDR
jgi:DNA-binding ferritin-like protein